jgi:DNA topoisomerase I
MQLVVVESPTKAKTLSTILGNNYHIEASMGHIRDLPKSGLGVDVAQNFEPFYIIPEKAAKTLDVLRKKAADAELIILATDPDREGEAIAWHINQILAGNVVFEDQTKKAKRGRKKKNAKPEKPKVIKKLPAISVPYKRVVFHELTKAAIEEAFAHPGEINFALVDAQQARRVLDRLVGYKLSPLLWKKVRYGLSAGRVQSVAVRLIVEKERERQAFKAEEYWTIEGKFQSLDKKRNLSAELASYEGKKLKIDSSGMAESAQNELNSDSFIVTSVKKTERRKNPYPPFKTSTLQQAMSNVFGFTAKRTMSAAQSLFEKGIITYHRTDSLTLSPQFLSAAKTFIGEKFGPQYVPEKVQVYRTKSKNAQEAHEAIRPTNLFNIPGHDAKMSPEELKVYSMIWKRSVESQILPAVYDQTAISISSAKSYEFRATGSVVKFDGWLTVGKFLNITEEDEDIQPLPDFKDNEAVTLFQLVPEQHFTQPPARYSDATLIKQLEELGIGRPSTYAPTIQTIQSRGYVQKDGRYFLPTDVAYVVTDLLVEHFPEVIDYSFTAHLEEELDEIAEGTKQWVPVIREFYDPFERDINAKDLVLQKTDVTNLGESGEMCPECGRPLVFKLGKYGKFLSCSGYPECTFAKPVVDTIAGDSSENADAAPQDYGKCPNCEDGVFVLKVGKFGKFLACSNYPKCKTAKPFLQKIGVSCPKCHEGDVVVKKARRKFFYGCSRYPDCDFASWTKPTGDPEKDAKLLEPKKERKTKKSAKTK